MSHPKLLRIGSLSLVLCTVVCWAYQSTLVKLTKVFDAAWMLWVIITVSFVVFSILLLVHGHSPIGPRNTPKKVRILLLIEPFFEVFGYGCVFYALQNAPLGDAVTLWDMDVIWTAILFSILQRRCPSRVHVGCICLAVVGVVLVCQPEIIFKHGRVSHTEYPNLTLGYITAFLSAMCFTCMFVLVAKLQELGIHWSVIEFNFGPVGFAILPLFTWAVNGWTPPPAISGEDWVAAIVIAVLDILARICATFALQVEAPPLVALTATLEIPCSYFFSYIFTGEAPNYLSAIGAGLIFTAVVIMGAKDLIDDHGTSDASLPSDEETHLLFDAENSAESNARKKSVSFSGRRGVAKTPLPTP